MRLQTPMSARQPGHAARRYEGFTGNTAHSNFDSFILDRGPDAQGRFNVGGNPHMAYSDAADKTGQQESFIDGFTAYKSHNSGIWARGEMHVFKNLKLADNGISYTHAYPGIQPGGGTFTSKVVDSLFVGETENIGNPRADSEKAYGRSLPYPEIADFPIRGFEYYDFLHHVENVTFRNFEDNATRKTGAISYLMYTSFGTSSENSVEHVKFENAKPVYFPPMERRWGQRQWRRQWLEERGDQGPRRLAWRRPQFLRRERHRHPERDRSL